MPEWSTSCPDWAARLRAGESIIPPPIFPEQAEQALAVFSGAFAGVVLALAAASVGLVVYSVRRRWLLAELLVVRKERGVGE